MKLVILLLAFCHVVVSHGSPSLPLHPGGIGGFFKGPNSETIIKGPDGSIITAAAEGGEVQISSTLAPVVPSQGVDTLKVIPLPSPSPELHASVAIGHVAPLINQASSAFAQPVTFVAQPAPVVEAEIVDTPVIEPKQNSDLFGPSGSISTRGSTSIVSGPASTTISGPATPVVASIKTPLGVVVPPSGYGPVASSVAVSEPLAPGALLSTPSVVSVGATLSASAYASASSSNFYTSALQPIEAAPVITGSPLVSQSVVSGSPILSSTLSPLTVHQNQALNSVSSITGSSLLSTTLSPATVGQNIAFNSLYPGAVPLIQSDGLNGILTDGAQYIEQPVTQLATAVAPVLRPTTPGTYFAGEAASSENSAGKSANVDVQSVSPATAITQIAAEKQANEEVIRQSIINRQELEAQAQQILNEQIQKTHEEGIKLRDAQVATKNAKIQAAINEQQLRAQAQEELTGQLRQSISDNRQIALNLANIPTANIIPPEISLTNNRQFVSSTLSPISTPSGIVSVPTGASDLPSNEISQGQFNVSPQLFPDSTLAERFTSYNRPLFTPNAENQEIINGQLDSAALRLNNQLTLQQREALLNQQQNIQATPTDNQAISVSPGVRPEYATAYASQGIATNEAFASTLKPVDALNPINNQPLLAAALRREGLDLSQINLATVPLSAVHRVQTNGQLVPLDGRWSK